MSSNPSNLSEKADHAAVWLLKLFVVGHSPVSAIAVNNLQKLAARHLPANTQIQIVDLAREPDAEGSEDVLAVPMLVRDRPQPIRRIIGDLADTSRVLQGLGLFQEG